MTVLGQESMDTAQDLENVNPLTGPTKSENTFFKCCLSQSS